MQLDCEVQENDESISCFKYFCNFAMDPNGRMSENLRSRDNSIYRSAGLHRYCSIVEGDLSENDVDHFLIINSPKGDSLVGSQHIQALEQTLGFLDFILQPTNCETMSANGQYISQDVSVEKRPKSFLHDEMDEFNQIFSELVSTPQRKFPCRDPGLLCGGIRPSHDIDSVLKPAVHDESLRQLLRVKSAPFGFCARESNGTSSVSDSDACSEDSSIVNDVNFCSPDCVQMGSSDDSRDQAPRSVFCKTDEMFAGQNGNSGKETQPLRRLSEDDCSLSFASDADSTLTDEQMKELVTLNTLQPVSANVEKVKLYEPMKEEDADSGYQTGDGSVPAMVSAAKKLEGVASLSRDDLLKRIENFNSNKRGLAFSLLPDSNVYEGSILVHFNIYRPIKMSLSSRPSSIYDILVRTDSRLPENESSVALFRLPSNTFKAIHISSETTSNAVIKTLLTKFNITDNPKRFALYERILPDEDSKKVAEDTLTLSNTLSFVRRLSDDDRPLELCLRWSDHGLDLLDRCQFVLQENDPGEIMWEDFSLPELSNFLQILSKEERFYADQIRTKYWLLKREIGKSLKNIENGKKTS